MTERIERPGFSGSTVLLALVGGAAAGAAIALLTAPKSGRETRAMLKEKLNDTKEGLTEAYKDGKEKARAFPGAAKVAGVAARNAFVEAMETSV